MSPVVLCEILALSVNTWTSDGKYPVQGCENLQLQFKCNCLKNEKLFLAFLFLLWILHQIWNTLKEKMIVIANVFPKLQTLKSFVRKPSQEHPVRRSFGSQHVKASEMLPKFPWEPFDHICLSFSVKLIGKISPLVLSEILGLFVNTLTAETKYPVQGSEIFQLPIEMQLSEKPKPFSQLFVPLLDFIVNFEHFEKKHDGHT